VTLSSTFALFCTMIMLASIPGVSVLTVSARAATFGFIHGAFTTLGIVIGDITFIILAIWGLAFLAETTGSFFVFIQYLGAVYLVVLGVGLWRSPGCTMNSEASRKSSLFSSFLTGLLITLADQKAVVFYLGFLPAFLDLSQVSYQDASIVLITAAAAVGSVKLGYAILAGRARILMSASLTQSLNRSAGAILITVGLFLLVRSLRS
jgi:threonine/homoserine/homoserine lactone efflux protein